MRCVVVGAGVGGLSAAALLAARGHDVTVVERGPAPGGKCARVTLDAGGVPVAIDAGPSLLTLPGVLQEVLHETGGAPLPLLAVEPVTRYRFADGTTVDLSADREKSAAALDAWSPGAGDDWRAFLTVCDGMWAASERFLAGPPPFPPRAGAARAADPRDALAVRPWQTLAQLARATVREPRLRMVVERFATYAGADPRRAPAALAVAGYVEHAFGAWHVPGGLYRIVEALAQRIADHGGALRCGVTALRIERGGGRVTGVLTDAGRLPADVVVWNGDALALEQALHGRPARTRRPRSSSGLALLLAVRGREPGRAHHQIAFCEDYTAEADDLFVARRPVRDPTVYTCTPWVTDPGDAPAGLEGRFVLVNAPAARDADWDAEADRLLGRLGLGDRVVARAVRSPADLAAETGALGGAIYGAAPHGRLGALRRPGPQVRGVRGLLRAGGTAHPGGGLPLVMLGGRLAASLVGPAR